MLDTRESLEVIVQVFLERQVIWWISWKVGGKDSLRSQCSFRGSGKASRKRFHEWTIGLCHSSYMAYSSIHSTNFHNHLLCWHYLSRGDVERMKQAWLCPFEACSLVREMDINTKMTHINTRLQMVRGICYRGLTKLEKPCRCIREDFTEEVRLFLGYYIWEVF